MHYKLFFHSEVERKKSYILLDVIFDTILYNQTIEVEISNTFVSIHGEPVMVTVPSFNDITAEKMTAFSPNTTGIPYFRGNKEMGMEILKQLFDLGCLLDSVTDIREVRRVFETAVESENRYRTTNYTTEQVLDDMIDNALSICLRKPVGQTRYDTLSKGISQARSFIFSMPFHIESAIVYAAKVAYLASLVKECESTIERYRPDSIKKLMDWQIEPPMDTKLNKLKKTNPEAFFYFYHIRL